LANFFYPPLDPLTVRNMVVVKQLVDEHPSYFLESPYPQALEADLLKLFKYTRHTVTMPRDVQTEEDLDVESELVVLFRSLKQAKPNASDGDQMAYYRTATALMERLLNLQDKAKNMKTMGEHHDMVLRFMSEICSPTQIEEFMTRLKDLS
jgi:hypothetical protein